MGLNKIQPRRGDIYFTTLPDRGPFILHGNHPVIVVQNNFGNFSSPKVLAIGGTSEDKPNIPTHFKVLAGDYGLTEDTYFCAEETHQVRIEDLGVYAGTVINTPYEKYLNDALMVEFGLKNPENYVRVAAPFAVRSETPKPIAPPAPVKAEFKTIQPAVEKYTIERQDKPDIVNAPSAPVRHEHNPEDGVVGLVFMKCPNCGNDYNTYLKEPKHELRCRCGEFIKLENLIPVSGTCECGNHIYGYTNHTESGFDIPCRRCETGMITVVRNKLLNRYVSPNDKYKK